MEPPHIARLSAALRERHLNLSKARQRTFEVLWNAPRPIRASAVLHDYSNLRLLVALGVAKEVWILRYWKDKDMRESQAQAPYCPACGQAQVVVEPVHGTDMGRPSDAIVIADWFCSYCGAAGGKERRWAAVKEPCQHEHLVCRDCGAIISGEKAA